MFTEFIAQVGNSNWFEPLLQGGSAGAVLGAITIWFATRAEKILEKLREAMERNTNALMIAVLSIKHLDEALRPLAEKIRDDSSAAIKKP